MNTVINTTTELQSIFSGAIGSMLNIMIWLPAIAIILMFIARMLRGDESDCEYDETVENNDKPEDTYQSSSKTKHIGNKRRRRRHL